MLPFSLHTGWAGAKRAAADHVRKQDWAAARRGYEGVLAILQEVPA